MPEYRSYSQWSDMNACPYSYQLKRVDRVDQIPAAWTAQGTAVHETLEEWERSERALSVSDMVSLYRDVYDREIGLLEDREPNLNVWFASGPYGADEDIPRRAQLGVDGLMKTWAWYDKHPDETPWRHPDGRLGIELAFTLDLDGVSVHGVVDWYGNIGGSVLGPRDYKSGRNPGKHMQLKLYDLAMDDHFEWRQEERIGGGVGDFFMTRTGKPTVAYDLTQVDRDEVAYEFSVIDEDIRAGHFPANPSPDNCKFCPVRRACKYRAV